MFHQNASNFEIEVSPELLSAQLLRNFTVKEVSPAPMTNQRLNLFHFIAEPINSTSITENSYSTCTLVWIESTNSSGHDSELGTHHISHDPEQDPWLLPTVPCHPRSSSDLQQCPVAATAASNAWLAHHCYTLSCFLWRILCKKSLRAPQSKWTNLSH